MKEKCTRQEETKMTEEQSDFFVTGKVIDYLNYKSYVDHKYTCSSSIESKMAVEAGYDEPDENWERKEHFRAGFCDGNRYGD